MKKMLIKEDIAVIVPFELFPERMMTREEFLDRFNKIMDFDGVLRGTDYLDISYHGGIPYITCYLEREETDEEYEQRVSRQKKLKQDKDCKSC